MFSKRKESNLYNSDIDNYIGVKKIKNFIVASINDYEEKVKGQDLKVISNGVVHLFNKQRNVTQEDLERVKSLQVFLGASISRAQIFTGGLTMLVGLSMIMDDSEKELSHLESEVVAQMGDSINMLLPLESLRKHLELYNLPTID